MYNIMWVDSVTNVKSHKSYTETTVANFRMLSAFNEQVNYTELSVSLIHFNNEANKMEFNCRMSKSLAECQSSTEYFVTDPI